MSTTTVEERRNCIPIDPGNENAYWTLSTAAMAYKNRWNEQTQTAVIALKPCTGRFWVLSTSTLRSSLKLFRNEKQWSNDVLVLQSPIVLFSGKNVAMRTMTVNPKINTLQKKIVGVKILCCDLQWDYAKKKFFLLIVDIYHHFSVFKKVLLNTWLLLKMNSMDF